ncbi:MAG: hypothetical protein HQK52_03355 [Oligoflexia bacterium]|nr:hypothetical protein [Oligoflexia bacterium]
MTVNSIDYARALAEERDKYRRAVRELNDTSKQELARLEKNSDDKLKLYRQNQVSAKYALEDSFDKRVGDIREGTRESIEKINKEYPKKLAEEQTRFQAQAIGQKDAYQRQLAEIGDSFRRANMHEREEHAAIEKNNQINYQNKLDSQRQQYGDQMDFVQDMARKNASDLQNRRRVEHESQSKEHQQNLMDMQKAETNKRMEAINSKENEVKVLKGEAAAEKKLSADKHDNLLSLTKKKNEEMITDLQKNFDRVGGQYREKVAINEEEQKQGYLKKTEKMLSESINDREDYNQRLSDLRNESDMKLNAPVVKNAEENRRLDHEKSIQHLNDKFEKNNELLHDSYTNDLERIKRASLLRERESLRDLNNYVLETLAQKDEQAKKVIDTYRRRDFDNIEGTRKKLDQMQAQNMDRIQHNALEFSKELDHGNQNAQQAMEKQREFYTERQRGVVAKKQQEIIDLIESMKKGHFQELEKTKDYLGERIENKEKEKVDAAEVFNAKIEQMDEQRVTENRYNSIVFDEKHKQDMEIMKDALDKKEREHDLKINEMRKMYDQRVDDITRQNAQQTRKLLAEAKRENQAQQLEFFHKAKSLEKNNMKEQALLKAANEMQTNSVISSYEDKIARMKGVHDLEIDKLKRKLEEKSNGV